MATYQSSLILAGGGQASPSVQPGTIRPVLGTVVIPASVTIGANDVIQLFNMSAGSAAHILDFFIDSPALDSGATLTVSLLDSTTPTPTTFFSASTTFRAGGMLTNGNALHGTIGPAVNYTVPNLIFLRAVAGAGANVGGSPVTINFWFSIARD